MVSPSKRRGSPIAPNVNHRKIRAKDSVGLDDLVQLEHNYETTASRPPATSTTSEHNLQSAQAELDGESMDLDATQQSHSDHQANWSLPKRTFKVSRIQPGLSYSNAAVPTSASTQRATREDFPALRTPRTPMSSIPTGTTQLVSHLSKPSTAQSPPNSDYNFFINLFNKMKTELETSLMTLISANTSKINLLCEWFGGATETHGEIYYG